MDIFPGDIRDPNGVRNALKGCEAVLHLAALVSIPFSYDSPDMFVETNIMGTLHILQAARDLGVKKIIHTSTSEVYGTAKYVPIKEDHPLQAQSPYSASKIGADQIAISFYSSFDTPVTILRPFNTFGPRQSARAVIPTIITQIAAGKKELKLGALRPTRDFNYIKDTVNGFIDALEAPKIEGETINIGSGRETSIGQMTDLIIKLMGQKVKINKDSKRIRPPKSEVDRLCADNRKAKKLLGWQPEYAGVNGLKRGLKETIDWFTNIENQKNYKPDIYNI